MLTIAEDEKWVNHEYLNGLVSNPVPNKILLICSFFVLSCQYSKST